MSDEKKKKKSYFSIIRILALLIWIASLVFLPKVIIDNGLMPPGTEFVAQFLISFVIFIILFDKLSFQVGVVMVIFVAFFSLFQPVGLRQLLDGLNNRVQDAFFVLRGPKKPSGQVIIVDIDQYSLETVGQWPWPRSESARVVKNLFEDGARVICFDIVYAEPGRFSVVDWLNRLDNLGVEMSFPGLSKEESLEKIENEEWEFTVPGEKIVEAVLAFWERRFEESDPDFWIEDEELRQEILVQKYLEVDSKQWLVDQHKIKESEASSGREYQIKPYQAPEYPLLSMARESGDLFFINSDWRETSVLEMGASIIPDNDEYLGQSFVEAPVVIGGLFILGARSGGSVLNEEIKATPGMVQSSPVWNAEAVFPSMREANQQVLNVPALQDGASFQGMFNIVPDQSGAARFYTMMLKAPVYEEVFVPKEGVSLEGEAALDPENFEQRIVKNMEVYPAIALQMLRVANGYNYAEATYRDGQSGIYLRRDDDVSFGTDQVLEDAGLEVKPFEQLMDKEMFIPIDFKGDLRINFLGWGGPWRPGLEFTSDYFMKYVSISDVLYKRFEPGTFKDKYVILGSTDPTLSDLVGSPFRPAYPGLEVHATMLENLLMQDFLVDLGDRGTLYTFLSLLVGGLILSALVAYTGPWLAGAFMGTVLTLLPLLSYYGMAEWGIVIEFVYPWLSTLMIGIIVILVNFFVEGREKRFLNATFKNYLSPELIDQMVESGASPKLGGEENVLTAYFTDIQSFSTFSEKLGSPTKLVELLNEYLTAMTDILMDNGGTLDKYEGDAIIAFFGAPMPLGNHAYASCKAALDMQDKLDELRKKWISEGDKWPLIVHQMRMRIGINTGPIVTGNMGSTMRMNYTMMGDTVNLAARLESGAKQYGVFSMCSQETLDEAGGNILSRQIDRVKVVGKTLPVLTCEVLHIDRDLADPQLVELCEKFNQAKLLYEQMKWDEAIALFQECLEIEPHHPERAPGCKTTPSHVFIERCEDYKENPPVAPGEEWDGVYTATSK